MPISLYNSLTRRTEPFAPLDPSRVTMYVCGPTVYNFVHIGNARGPVVFDVLARLLRRHYPNVVYARNITDVDDKINAAAQEQGVGIDAITGRFTQAYRQDMADLGIQPPDVEPRATAHIDPIIAMIEQLIVAGHAYAAEGHVLFDVASYAEYGRLSGRDTDELIAGARIEVAPYKRNPADFVLWKPSTPELPGWDSPWSRGRPGWHIECSAMCASHLGETIDIHAGGVDLLFPHHENEIAQSTCAHGGKTFARWWLHNGMLTFGGAKMSKSLGNIEKVHDLLQQHPAEALRYALLSAHYRQPLDWSGELVEQSNRTLDRLYGTLRDLADVPAEPALPADVAQALEDDLNTPAALAAINGHARQARLQLAASGEASRDALVAAKSALLGAGAALGLLQQSPEVWFKQAGGDGVDPARVEALLEQRREARAARDFARADAIRDELSSMGVVIEDGAQGTRWSVAKG
ncbi:cysteine--tRNA ligase [Dyella sp. A6]|uniref:cysteine--tRNA ligase n=1 Tax=Dyella aluminiiresistens TaxID=3069105 RepID=UPI002E75F23B|nr:cysteine--tRNA ligase [Dyella sp. A6]